MRFFPLQERSQKGDKMKKLILSTVITIFFTSIANAGFLMFPQRIVFDQNGKTQSIRISNSSPAKKTYRIKFVHFMQDESGKLTEITKEQNGLKFAKKKLRYGPKKITLLPGKTQTINVMVKNYNSIKEGEYRSHLSVIEKDTTKEKASSSSAMAFSIKADFGLTIPIVIRKGKLDVQSTIKSAVLKTDKDEKAQLNITLTRKGRNSIRGEINVYKFGEENKKIKIGTVNNFVLYENVYKRAIPLSLYENLADKNSDRMDESDIEGEKIIVEFVGDKNTLGLKVEKKFEL